MKQAKSPPKEILEEFRIHSETEWTIPNTGSIAETFISPDFVVQQRDRNDYERFSAVIRYLEYWQGNPLFEGTRSELILSNTEGFWVKTDLINTPEEAYPWQPYASSEEWWSYFEQVLPAIKDTLRELRKGPELPEELKQLDLRGGKNLQTVPTRQILDIIYNSTKANGVKYEDISWIRDLDPEPVLPSVTSHGDVLIKNTVLGSNGFRLIDWEFLSELPADRDISRIVWHLLNRMPVETWGDKIPLIESLYEEFVLDEVANNPVYRSVDFKEIFVWGGLRTLATWPNQGKMVVENKRAFGEILAGIKSFV